MAPAARSDGRLNLNLSDVSNPLEQPLSAGNSPFNGPKPLNNGIGTIGSTRTGTASPLLESGTRRLSKRTRELQGQTLSPSIWGPPTSGTSSPLHLIPESPSQDSFPDLVPLSEVLPDSSKKRNRAGTLPSRISPIGSFTGLGSALAASKTSRPTPSTSPFRPHTSTAEQSTKGQSIKDEGSENASLLSRQRTGSMPQRSSLLGNMSPFGASVFSPSWTPRNRAATLMTLQSEDPISPAQSSFLKEGMNDSSIRTLDYLGLVETPQSSKVTPSTYVQPNMSNGFRNLAFDSGSRSASRQRSVSVNTPGLHIDETEDPASNAYLYNSRALASSAAAAIEAEFEMVHEKVRQHNYAVQEFERKKSAARPRSSTAGIIEAPQRQLYRSTIKAPSPIPSEYSSNVAEPRGGLVDSMQALGLNYSLPSDPYEFAGEDDGQASRSLWIGNIPVSMTTSSLDAVFSPFGSLESTRVLSHKNCGFVNFEKVEDAVRAKQYLNYKEIFPGSGLVRIGFAKVPSASAPTVGDMQPASNSSDHAEASRKHLDGNIALNGHTTDSVGFEHPVRLPELQPEILSIVLDFGAQQTDLEAIAASIQNAASYQSFEKEIPSVPEPTHSRMYDAPRLRDIRKRIDNGSYSLPEIEQIAIDMLPEVAELASDYLGNTVVQKLFEICGEPIKEQMLGHIAPHLGEIGVHKNGTWAAQKIIEVCKTHSQTTMIVESLRPYTVPLFLDQYGNYVLQCCLRFGAPYNDFIFETMLSRMGEIAQGRFGARAMRACLESHHATKHQQRMLAAAIALNVVELARNANSALLLTWLLDTCNFPARRIVLAPRLRDSLVEMCTHKVSYLTVLKIINQRSEPEARDMILEALFFSPGDHILEQILSDQSSGATLIFKILTTPFFEEQMRPEVVRNVTRVLNRIKAQPSQGYKRLMDEVGMSSRPSYPSFHGAAAHQHPFGEAQARPMSQPVASSFPHPSMPPRQYSGNVIPSSNYSPFQGSQSPLKSNLADAYGYSSYPFGAFTGQEQYPPM